MKVLMLGWEFPPYISGGLGTACLGLTRALDVLGAQVTFVLPRGVIPAGGVADESMRGVESEYISNALCQKFGLRNTRFHAIPSVLQPYQSVGPDGKTLVSMPPQVRQAPGSVAGPIVGSNQVGVTAGQNYTVDMGREIHRYADLVEAVGQRTDFSVIHAHDWMTFPASLRLREISGKPLLLHVHSTEFDRSGDRVNQFIYDIERAGLHHADRIVAVSYLTKRLCMARYGVEGSKIDVVYNGVDWDRSTISPRYEPVSIEAGEKIVLFLGRITMQKGPEYFVAAAKRVLEKIDDVKFIMAGNGDQITHIIELAAHLGIGHKMLFTGFLRGSDVDRVFAMADLYVMPSVSEPFGIAPLEALSHGVPVIISKQSGVAEVLTHALKVDFWDIDEMANKIIAVLRHRPLQSTLRDHGHMEASRLSWSDSAAHCLRIYSRLRGREAMN